MRITLLEDNPTSAALIRFYLVKNGHVVDWVDKVEEKLFDCEGYWKEHDCLVADVMLAGSGRNGLYVTEWLAENCPDIQRVVCTALTHITPKLPDWLANYVPKPFKESQLIAAIETPNNDRTS